MYDQQFAIWNYYYKQRILAESRKFFPNSEFRLQNSRKLIGLETVLKLKQLSRENGNSFDVFDISANTISANVVS